MKRHQFEGRGMERLYPCPLGGGNGECGLVRLCAVHLQCRFHGGVTMITKFGSLFAGHVDLDDIGYDGLPVNDRWLSDERLASVFEKAEAIAKTLDDSGFDTMWLAEHHFQREGHECIPNNLMLAVHLSHFTERIKFGCGFNITPMWHP
ncbi:MAG: LLM class flavin-dependent oxidoreductase, partial [Dehalococcoidia bacterium]|nr:LLM class flavin-dependent oxidoreductase [Dehalococcoidia bacterium]